MIPVLPGPYLEHKSFAMASAQDIDIICHFGVVPLPTSLGAAANRHLTPPPPTTPMAELAYLNLWDMCRGGLSYQEQTSPYLPAD